MNIRALVLEAEQIFKAKDSLEREYKGKPKGQSYYFRSNSLTKRLKSVGERLNSSYKKSVTTYQIKLSNGLTKVVTLDSSLELTEIELLVTWEFKGTTKVVDITKLNQYLLGQFRDVPYNPSLLEK